MFNNPITTNTTNTIVIRIPDLSDLQGLIYLWRGQYDYHHNLDSTYYVSNSEELDKKFKKYLEQAIKKSNPNILVAEKEGKLIGFITYEKVDADYFDTNIIEHGDILELYVDPKYRKMGAGKKLMIEVEKFFKNKGVEYLSLQCSTFNKNALDFYKKYGFTNRQSLLYKRI